MVRCYHCSQPCDKVGYNDKECMVKQTLSHGWDGREKETGESVLYPLRPHANDLKTSHKVPPLSILTVLNSTLCWGPNLWQHGLLGICISMIIPKYLLNVWCSKTLIYCYYFGTWPLLYRSDYPPNCSLLSVGIMRVGHQMWCWNLFLTYSKIGI